MRVVLLVFLISIAAFWAYFRQDQDQSARHLSFVPPALAVERVLYSAEEAWGFGPGGNEAGIIVYAMSEATQEQIEAGGISWLNGLPGRGAGGRGALGDWQATPFDAVAARASRRLGDEMTHGLCGMGDGIAAYMARYGFCIPFDPEVQAMADRALAQPGSLYTFRSTGMLLLIPSESRVVYAFNG